MNKQVAIVKVINVLYQGDKETWYIDGVETPKDEVVDFISPIEAIIEAPDTSELVFKPEKGDKFYYIGDYASNRVAEDRFHFDKDMNKLLKVGNCFRTEEDAKNSAKYYFMNSEYDYWFPWTGQPKPKVLPKGLEFWNLNYGEWDDSGYKDPSHLDNLHVYRWKRAEQ